MVRILPCISDNNVDCANLTPDSRKEAIRNRDFALNVGNFDLAVNIENLTKPVQPHELLSEKALYAKGDETFNYQQQMVTTYIEDLFGFPFKNRNLTSYVSMFNTNFFERDSEIKTSCSFKEVDTQSTTCPPYFVLEMRQNPKKIVELIQRKYLTPIELISNIGGFYTAIWLAFTLSYKLFFSSIIKYKMVERMFGFVVHSRFSCCRNSKSRFSATTAALFNPAVENYNSALKVLDGCLDVYSLVQQLTLLRIILDFMLEPRAKELGPSTALSQQTIQDRKTREDAEKISL